MIRQRSDTGSEPVSRPNREKSLQKIRLIVQIAFALLCIWIGIEFHSFVKFIEGGGQGPIVSRPPGVDGFLPISSLMSLYYFFLSGIIHPYHPSGVFILSAIILMSLLFGKSFCSWLCPVGLISEFVADFGEKIFGRRITPPRWLDYPLRSLKYLLLAFFVYSIFIIMDEMALRIFLDSAYNLVADIRMYYFFADISQFALITIGILLLLSIVIRGFWCRYLCPYGALLGLCSLLSLNKIKRNEISCIDCGRCAVACPSRIKVDKVKTVVSDECTACLNCVDVCPVADTLDMQFVPSRTKINKRIVAIAVVGLFMIVTGAAMISGYWQNDISVDTYLSHNENIMNYGHPRSTDDVRNLNRNQP